MGNINNDSNRLATDTPNTTTTTTTGGVSVTFSSLSNGPCNLTFTPDCGGTPAQNQNQRLATDTPDATTTTTQPGEVTIPGINFPYTFYPSEHGVDDIFGTYTFNCGGCEFIRNIERVCNDSDITYTILGGEPTTTTTTEDETTTTSSSTSTTSSSTSTTSSSTSTTSSSTTSTTTTSSGCTSYLLKSGTQFTEFSYIKCGDTAPTVEGIRRNESKVVCSENVPVITIDSDGAEVIDTGISCTDDNTTTTTEGEVTRYYISAGKALLGSTDQGPEGEPTGFCDNTYLLTGALWISGNGGLPPSLLGKTVYDSSDLDTYIPQGYYYASSFAGYPDGNGTGAEPGDSHQYIQVVENGIVGDTGTHDCGTQGGGNNQ